MLGRMGRRGWDWVDRACPAVGQGSGRSMGGVRDDPQVLMQVGVSGRLREEQVGKGWLAETLLDTSRRSVLKVAWHSGRDSAPPLPLSPAHTCL